MVPCRAIGAAWAWGGWPPANRAAVVPPSAKPPMATNVRNISYGLCEEPRTRAALCRPADLGLHRAALDDPQFDDFALGELVVGGELTARVGNIADPHVGIAGRAQREPVQRDWMSCGTLHERIGL